MRDSADEALRYAAAVRDDPAGAVRRWKALSGGKAVGCIPLHFPEEVLRAAGMLPVTVWGDEFPSAPPADVPPSLRGVVRGILGAIRGGLWDALDAWAVPLACDSIREAVELQKSGGQTRPPFPVVFSPPGGLRKSPESLLDGIEAFIEWAGTLSGRPVTEGALDKAIAAFNANRRLFARLEERMAESPGAFTAAEFLLLARAGSLLPKETHTEVIRSVLARGAGPERAPRARIFLAGVMATDEIGSALDAAGAALVGNDLGRGRRYYEGTAAESGDAAVSLVRRHLSLEWSAAPHGAGAGRIDSLFRRVASCGADRLLLLRVVGCRPEGTDASRIADEARVRGIPFLAVDVDPGRSGAAASLAARVGAFVETGE